MNKIETLKKNVWVDNQLYSPKVYLTAWDKWCISYVKRYCLWCLHQPE